MPDFTYSTALRRTPAPPNHSPYAHTTEPTTPSARFSLAPVADVLRELDSDPHDGLSTSTVISRRSLAGSNDFHVSPGDPLFKRLLEHFNDPLLLLLLGSAGISLLIGNTDDAVSITLALIIVVSVAFIQEQRSRDSLRALTNLVPHYCHLIRDGQKRTELANVLVPGDIITLSLGDRVPADARLLEVHDLDVDESTLTGETNPSHKHTAALESPQGSFPHIGDRENIVFMGTLVKSGTARAVVVAIGEQTEFGSIFSTMSDIQERKTPLQLSMDDLAKRLSYMSFIVIGIICVLGLLQRRPWLDMFTIGVSLAVAAIPEGLPIVVSVTLALGVVRMSKRKAIVKKLPSVETLGAISVVCADKTGTLTANQMCVTHMFTVPDGVVDFSCPPVQLSEAQSETALVGNLCNHSYLDSAKSYTGKPTEVALMNILQTLNLSDQRPNFTIESQVPFDSEKKYQSVMGYFNGSTSRRQDTYVAGALESVLPLCSSYIGNSGSVVPLDDEVRDLVTAKCNEMSQNALRVIALASSQGAPNMAFAGCQGIIDPPRVGVSSAISRLSSAGVRVVMITGDSPPTALAIARQVGLNVTPSGRSCMTGKELDVYSQRELVDRTRDVTVFARTTPRHKMAIIEAFQMQGAVVGMTGDGVNDAPALKMADIGISMGKGGTDVAKEAADVILVDDNFATILPAVEEGKSIFYNIQNFLGFQLSTAVSALVLITLSTALGLPTPLNAMQILFINILMDGPPSQSLGVDPVNTEVMRKPPRSKHAPVLTKRLIARIIFSASIITLGCSFIFLYELAQPDVQSAVELGDSESTRDQTMTFTAFVFLDLVSAIQNRGLKCLLHQNKMLVWTVTISFLVQLSLIYLPVLQSIFQTEALSLRDLIVLLILAGCSAGLHEFRRSYERLVSDSPVSWEDRTMV